MNSEKLALWLQKTNEKRNSNNKKSTETMESEQFLLKYKKLLPKKEFFYFLTILDDLQHKTIPKAFFMKDFQLLISKYAQSHRVEENLEFFLSNQRSERLAEINKPKPFKTTPVITITTIDTTNDTNTKRKREQEFFPLKKIKTEEIVEIEDEVEECMIDKFCSFQICPNHQQYSSNYFCTKTHQLLCSLCCNLNEHKDHLHIPKEQALNYLSEKINSFAELFNSSVESQIISLDDDISFYQKKIEETKLKKYQRIKMMTNMKRLQKSIEKNPNLETLSTVVTSLRKKFTK